MSSRPRFTEMSFREKLILAVLLVLILASLAGIWLTQPSSAPVLKGKAAPAAAQAAPPVNTEPLQTATTLRSLAASEQEQELANRALRLGDDAVDLAFSIALRDAYDRPAPQTPEITELSAKIKASEDKLAQDQTWIQRLQGPAKPVPTAPGASTAEKANAGGSKPPKRRSDTHTQEATEDEQKQRLEFAQARLALDQDELADAKQDLIRAGGDRHGMIQRMLDEHEATHQSLTAAEASVHPPPQTENKPTVVARIGEWRKLREKQQRLAAAEQTARETVLKLQLAHAGLEHQIAGETAPERPSEDQKPDAAARAAATTAIRRRSRDMKTLAEYDKWIQNEQELAATYNQWSSVISAQRQAQVHGLLQALLAILSIVLLVVIADFLVTRFYLRLTPERKRLRSLRYVARFSLQAIGLLFIAFIVFGLPGQLTTVLGLAGAGLTVALKDFIVAFFGWFVLMGKDGIRVGDWVEINGIGGEVLEIGLLRTILLETGAWADAGHPTGRKVAFVNSFAIEGHYFNFSTSGQWLWDTIEVLLPPGEDPYPVVEGIKQIALRETEAGGRVAEDEWRRVAHSQSLRSFSAAPSIDVKPTNVGVSISVRYITRAHERYELRSRLYRAALQLLQNRNIPEPAVAGRSVSPGASD